MSFSPTAEPTKLIFNFLSLIRRGSCYGPLGLYATVLVVLLPWWPSVHGAPLFRGCIILPLETRYFLPPLSTLDCANEPHVAAVCGVHTHRPIHLDVPTWRINSRETNNPPLRGEKYHRHFPQRVREYVASRGSLRSSSRFFRACAFASCYRKLVRRSNRSPNE